MLWQVGISEVTAAGTDSAGISKQPMWDYVVGQPKSSTSRTSGAGAAKRDQLRRRALREQLPEDLAVMRAHVSLAVRALPRPLLLPRFCVCGQQLSADRFFLCQIFFFVFGRTTTSSCTHARRTTRGRAGRSSKKLSVKVVLQARAQMCCQKLYDVSFRRCHCLVGSLSRRSALAQTVLILYGQRLRRPS